MENHLMHKQSNRPASWIILNFLVLFCLFPRISFSQENSVPSSSASGKLLNPDLSLDGLYSLSQFNNADPLTFTDGHDPKQNGFNLQQIELTLGSAVDPYFRADANIVIVPEDGETKIEIEEAYATSLNFPWNLQIKAGSFFTAFGRNNPVHPHAWDFTNKPLVLGRMFGGDGLRNPGAQVSWLTPFPWYSELTVSGQNSIGETAASFRPDGKMRSMRDSMALTKWNNFFSLSDDFSMNLGASYLTGPNVSTDARRITKIAGGDFYLKYRNPGSLSFIALQAEYLKRFYESTGSTLKDHGMYAQLIYRLPEPFHRWHAGVRYDWVSGKELGSPITSPGPNDPITNEPTDRDLSKRFRVSPVITFYPSEFSKVRLQYDYDKPTSYGKTQQVASLQFEFLIGAHGAHKF